LELDLGDVVAVVNLRVKHRCCPILHLVWHVGVPFDTTEADRIIKPPPYASTPGKVDLIMDLQADKQVPLSVQFTDEVGNPVDTPAGATVAYTVDDPTVINLTDAGDGTATAAAVGALGTANVHVDASFNGTVLTGDLQIVVVAGLAERLTVVAGEPVEVTPDV
jgi:hypothetical protein